MDLSAVSALILSFLTSVTVAVSGIQVPTLSLPTVSLPTVSLPSFVKSTSQESVPSTSEVIARRYEVASTLGVQAGSSDGGSAVLQASTSVKSLTINANV